MHKSDLVGTAMMWTGAELKSVRESAGVSLTQLSRTSHFTIGHLSNVENGRRVATADVVRAYEQALGENMTLRRRHLLMGGAAIGGVALVGGTATDGWHPDPELSDRFAHASSGVRVDLRAVERIAGALAAQRQAEDVNGGRNLWPAVRSQLDAVTRLFPKSSGAVTDRLLLIAAEHAHWLSWVAESEGHRGPALRWLDMANGWGTDAGSFDMLSWATRVRSLYALRAGDPARALRTADVAYRLPGISAGAASIAAHQAALAAAAIGETEHALRLGDEAYALAQQVPNAEERPAWLYWLTPVRAKLHLGSAAYAAQDWRNAVAIFHECLGELTGQPRDHAHFAAQLEDAQRHL